MRQGILNLAIKIAVFIIGGASLGYCSAQTAIIQGIGVNAIRNGPWIVWPSAGNPKADPYTRAHFARTGELPLASFESVIFRSFQDDSGERLTSACEYTLHGSPIDVRWWNLTVYGHDGTLIANPADRYSFNSDNILLNADGSFKIGISRQPLPGNWIPLQVGDDRSFFVTFRLFGPGQNLLNRLGTALVPKIVKGRCA